MVMKHAPPARLREFQLEIDKLGEKFELDHIDIGYACMQSAVTYSIMCRKPDMSRLDHKEGLLYVVSMAHDKLFDKPEVQAAFAIYSKHMTARDERAKKIKQIYEALVAEIQRAKDRSLQAPLAECSGDPGRAKQTIHPREAEAGKGD